MFFCLQNLLEPKANTLDAARLLAECLNHKITSTSLSKEIQEHSDYPSLSSISDALSSNGIETLSVTIKPERLSNLAPPLSLPL